MKIVGFDLETTGLLAPEHRIVEIYAGLWDLDTRELIEDLNQRIDPQRSIAADAQRVHGISGTDLIGKPTFEMLAPTIHAFITDADLVVAHNGDEFDLPFINMELTRVGLSKSDSPSFDTMTCRWSTPSGKPPSLAEFCFACDVEYDPAKAHAADYDVHVMMTAFFRGLDWGWIKLEPVS